MACQHHIFAFYSAEPLRHHVHDCIIEDKALIYRLSRIVRLKIGEQFMLFDGTICQTFSIIASDQNRMTCRLVQTQDVHPLKPEIHWLIPLLERDAMERVVYFLAACGITSWTPIVAEKSHRNYLTPKEFDRLKRITIAACEQAKQFCLPIIHPARTFNEIPDFLEKLGAARALFFDPDGVLSDEVVSSLREQNVQSMVCMIGPEGDLVEQEKKVLSKLGFTFCALVPTILRAEDACSLASGMLRSLVR
jgi:RsmE family RNA methyltransferase